MDKSLVLEAAVKAYTNKTNLPSTTDVLTALLESEKSCKTEKRRYSFDALEGTWRLIYITGTQKAQSRLGSLLNQGRYLPRLFNIEITYGANPEPSPRPMEVENRVGIGGLRLTVSGPVKFLMTKNILGFDFTQIQFQLLGATLFQGYIAKGKERETSFYEEKIGKQAFFSYFYVGEQAIAARGRGGGLAMWGRVS